MTTVTVEVTQADLDNGERKLCRSCPVALALQRATGTAWYVEYSGATICRGGERRVDFPLTVAEFIRDFDDGAPVQPFSFVAEIREGH